MIEGKNYLINMRKEKKEIELGEVTLDYLPQFDIFSEDDDRMYNIKYIIFNYLTDAEKNALLFYAESRSQRKLSEKLGVSLALTNRYLKSIQEKIKTKLN